jgi:hypothetical protein
MLEKFSVGEGILIAVEGPGGAFCGRNLRNGSKSKNHKKENDS